MICAASIAEKYATLLELKTSEAGRKLREKGAHEYAAAFAKIEAQLVIVRKCAAHDDMIARAESTARRVARKAP